VADILKIQNQELPNICFNMAIPECFRGHLALIINVILSSISLTGMSYR